MRERIRYLHYSLRTEQAYVYWVRDFVRWSGLRHPRLMGKSEVEDYLSMLANHRRVSASTHKQALSKILFPYQEIVARDLPWMGEIGRPSVGRRLPSVLTQDEVATVLGRMTAVEGLLARLIYGTGMRVSEALTPSSPLDTLPISSQ